jgi:hypothetical protein
LDIHVDRSAPWPRNPWHAFPYPPSTDEQIAQTERELGVELPLVLRALYQQLGNGGFGPGVWLARRQWRTSCRVKPGTPVSPRGDSPPDPRQHAQSQFLACPFHDLACLEQDPEASLSEVPQPGMTVSLAGWGCDIYTLLDCESGSIYGFAQGGLEVSASSLSQWLEQWLAGTLIQPFSGGNDAVWLRAFGEQEWARFHVRPFSDQ